MTLKPEDMTLEQLRDEVWFWRTDAAARLAVLKVGVDTITSRSSAGREARRVLGCLSEILNDALAGRYHPRCFCCGFSMRPGDAVISDVNEGEMHADCPEEEGGAQGLKPGDKVFMDPESIIIDEDHPEGGESAEKPDHLIAHEATRLYTHEQIVARAMDALAVSGAQNSLS